MNHKSHSIKQFKGFFFHHCLYRFDEAVQVLHLESVWVPMVEVLKLFQQGLMVHCPACKQGNNEKVF